MRVCVFNWKDTAPPEAGRPGPSTPAARTRCARAGHDVPVLCVSESSRASLRQYGLRRVEVLPEGMERRVRPDVPKEAALTLIVLGRLAPVKQVDHAIAAFRGVRARVPGARLWVVGD